MAEPQVIDLMDALKKSLKEEKQSRERREIEEFNKRLREAPPLKCGPIR